MGQNQRTKRNAMERKITFSIANARNEMKTRQDPIEEEEEETRPF